MSTPAQPQYPVLAIFGEDAGPSYIQLPIPVPSQQAVTPGASSFTDGFPPQNFVAPANGGVPPRGVDFNGLFYMLSAYAFMLEQGGLRQFSAATATAISGYPQGALIAKANGVGFWFNTIAGNTTNPDTSSISVTTAAGWIGWNPEGNALVADSPAGTVNNYNASGNLNAGTRFLDVTTGSGSVIITGISAALAYDGQVLTVAKADSGAGSVTLEAMNGGSTATNQLRLPGGGTILGAQYAYQTLRYQKAVGLWLPA